MGANATILLGGNKYTVTVHEVDNSRSYDAYVVDHNHQKELRLVGNVGVQSALLNGITAITNRIEGKK